MMTCKTCKSFSDCGKGAGYCLKFKHSTKYEKTCDMWKSNQPIQGYVEQLTHPINVNDHRAV